ncbi:hypothetical protein JXZ92_00600 [Mycoplasma sp. CSL10137]|uniref:hypothetical protein n=1 Tax=unclassified Mycoplasma TaxID=2683645 RepID=UPI00197BB884|nr:MULTISPECIES: hypothetical protein [unclassified Mycoplasma]MBN4083322.1 hypothetical protein [Mycoplasma sp. CSL10137]MBN4084375.1 hypothetical protein [Mycoplasma sp. CSL10166]MBU4692861.1 hypothetical protein [Mycoplasma sp. CSL7491-lung]
MDKNLDNVLDFDKLKSLAEEYNDHNQEAKRIKKEIESELGGLDFEINERLNDGGVLSYKPATTVTKVDRKMLLNLLYKIIIDADRENEKIPNDEELKDKIQSECTIEKEVKWKVTIKKGKNVN